MSKASFIRKLQSYDKPLHPSDISQLVRNDHNAISACRFDDELDPEFLRGYMIEPNNTGTREFTTDNPAVYWCVVSTKQSPGWQHLTWAKEILQILDDESHKTDNKEKLRAMLENRIANEPNCNGELPNVVADKNGFLLALGCIVPRGYRELMRQENHIELFSLTDLASILFIPEEYVKEVIADSFEDKFEERLSEIYVP